MDVEELRGLLSKATLRTLVAARYSIKDMDGDPLWLCGTSANGSAYNAADELAPEDAALIVAAVNALPGLLDEIERLRALAKANNDLARMYGKQVDEWRAKAVRAMDALEQIAEAQVAFNADPVGVIETMKQWARTALSTDGGEGG